MPEGERKAYEDYLAYLGQELGILYSAKAEGKEEGLQEGLVKGKEEGIKEGVKKGKIETAKNLISLGLNIEIIRNATGLSVSEIEDLRRDGYTI